MIELLQRAAQATPDQPAIVTNTAEVSYRGLLERAEAIAAGLAARGVQRFGIVDDDAIHVVALLAAADLAGAEACVYPGDDPIERIADLADRFDHGLLVSDRDDLAWPGVEVLPIDALLGGTSAESPPPAEARPLLVLTTGTTGLPKGVRHDWSRVLRPFLRVQPSPEERWLLAYGVHQFGGLQLLLHVLAAGATLVHPSPLTAPAGLAAMRAHDVDHASATPTYWRFVLAELASDGGEPPSLRQITLGGEAVPSRVLDDLRAAFPGARVSQIYAANESGSVTSVRDGRNGLPASVLEEDPDADVSLKIVDGELWVRSRIGMIGYHGEDPIDPDAWRPTGDLVEVVGDRVLFSGRTSEVINVGGVKVHPLPIEERIGAVPGVAMVRVFGRPSGVTGSIVAAEVVAAPGADREELDRAVRDACADLPAAARPRSIKFVDSLATRGHKMVRQATT